MCTVNVMLLCKVVVNLEFLWTFVLNSSKKLNMRIYQDFITSQLNLN